MGLVLEFQKATVDDVYAAVCELEPQCVRRLADFHTDADLAALGEALKSESRAGSPEGLWECQDQFHRLLVIRAGNGAIEVLIESLRHVIDLANRKYLREVADRPDVREEAASRSREAHRAVVKLIEQRRAAEAEELWRQHILDTGRRLKESGAMHSVLDLLDGS
ncbi:FadR/GntR family transcriptional regulator [Rhodococcus oxybenzonivorans]|uniref:FadR/GntR family transcriptional regulator n=1 Tax=Rhodococcus oxybenzonivorans TaxID=1990687 RepID=UPI002952D841|nr:FCD domain-containing protein [Rhodococcus oxybenzonivorans]